MSKVDDVFRPIPVILINEWGMPAVFIEVTGNTNYDPSTGTITPDEIRYDVLAVIDNVRPEEYRGQQEDADYLIYIKPEEINDHYVTTRDRMEFQKNGKTVKVRIVDVITYRGERPVGFEIYARQE